MASIARALVRCSIAWGADATGYIVVGTSTVGGSDTVGPAGPDVRLTGAFSDVSALLVDPTWERGRSEDFTAMEGGTATIGLRDANGTYNPENPASPLAGELGARLHPIRLEASLDLGATWQGLFGGWVKSIAPTVGARKSTVALTCVDLFYWLNKISPVLANVGPETTGAWFGRIFAAVGLVDPDFRIFDKGDYVRNGHSADGTTTAAGLIQASLESERGVLYADGYGRGVYLDRHSLAVAASSGTITGIMRAIAPGTDADRVSNLLTITVVDAAGATVATVTASDDASRRAFGDSSLGDITTGLIDPWEADDLGAYILSQTSGTRGALRSMAIDSREVSLLTHVVERELGDVITATEAVAGTTGDYRVEHISGAIDTETGELRADYMLSAHVRNTTALIVGTGQVGTGTTPY